jgi:hypothetical protein
LYHNATSFDPIVGSSSGAGKHRHGMDTRLSRNPTASLYHSTTSPQPTSTPQIQSEKTQWSYNPRITPPGQKQPRQLNADISSTGATICTQVTQLVFFHHMKKQVTTHLIHSITRPPQIYTVQRRNIHRIHLNKCCTEAQPHAAH